MLRLNKLDYLNVGGCALAVIGFILGVIGCAVLSVPEGIGVNTDLSPMVYVGIALIVLGLAAAITGNAFYKSHDMNRVAASVTIYVAVILLMVMILVVAYTIFILVINPSNG
ncbi:MAG TPA: hypothetical protein IAB90_07030 [Candidatus Coproplasma stercoripullorum]|uniref:Uncharacterized protein n=1 Tax=Candidatus Coproplasma stercoripullorum TaxID=2840751 RepID=A0A9D1AH41_9FIRM|nr:hypothetical protein [Candidatus Coproplasma stercoripullorum]